MKISIFEPVKLLDKRDHYLDFLRGVATLNIIFIHTVWWSGQAYTPLWIRSISLLLDVPLFFFISGWGFAYNCSPLHTIMSIWKMQKNYWLFLILYLLLLMFFKPEQLLNGNLLAWSVYIYPEKDFFMPVFKSSMWFIVVYIPVAILLSLLIKAIDRIGKQDFYYKWIILFLFIGFLYSSEGRNFIYLSNKILFYGFFYILGFLSKDYRIRNIKCLLFLLILTIIAFFAIGTIGKYDISNVQSLKFPPTIAYMFASGLTILIALFLKGKYIPRYNHILVHIGRNAISYYFAQGISSSILIDISPFIQFEFWVSKVIIMFALNLCMVIPMAELLVGLYKCLSLAHRKLCKI